MELGRNLAERAPTLPPRHRPTNKPTSHTRQPPTNVDPYITDQTGTGKSTVFFSTRDGSDQAFCLLAEHGNLD